MDKKQIEKIAQQTCKSYNIKLTGAKASKDGRSIMTCGKYDSGDLHLDVVVFDKLDD